MGRSKNIGELAHYNFVAGDGYTKRRYDKTKSDQDVVKAKGEHARANPFNPLVCPFLELGVWFSLNSELPSKITHLFSTDTVTKEAPSKKCASGLSKLLKENIEAASDSFKLKFANELTHKNMICMQ